MNNIKRFFRYISKNAKYIDYPLVVTYLLLCLIGLVMVYSASMVAATKGSLTGGISVSGTYFYTRQLMYVIMSLVIVFFMAFFMNVKLLETIRFQKWMMIGIIILLAATLVVGSNINGSKSWINLGFMNLQASELLKIAIILYIPYMIEKKRPKVFKQPKLMTSPIILAGLCIALVLLQRDVGQTLLIMIIFVSILFYAGIGVQKSIKYGLLIIVGVVIIGSLFLIIGLVPDYLTARFSTLTNPFSQESGKGYHISNSLIAIGNGGLLGRGLGNSIMKLGYLPEPHTDFIFSIICEELGLVGGLVVICLLFFIVYRAFELANKTNSYFYKLVCVGVASYIGSQTFVNLGGISGTIPLTGVPLPFISFGGSSMISLSIALGLLLITGKQIRIEAYRKKQANKKKTHIGMTRRY
ncbi:FtsW/RodA/SpoVE family cell cycle protein [Staphylococcus saprophyticus]|uniref:cell division peptidoglycan polymerase FtsW n=1 Tax=Staphylococcus saprophyticus TaxID=29385 RepID=UPI00118C2BDC|nr:FtsW/RodA/SpoVE family cell cycle protein [Staphylococcus saprophyticus]MDW4223828.1 FtsW/RodA/SpoVE family cell cycle protein [Staphylococcus saprophyticus]MDW4226090.1 FtsW/RodA/SpoVE family cell cycle protein [Staphylococcus saprophyticus]MDW4231294.1 FtsW/RodA/SpoVE family cell cycle protein [Staphylococcus saprophyticus]MDW4245541.1 FtsW/RodA/SpoVE family cell cycle protein [Staphylococcus saprophyticus]MDW4257866.1 FtsW/RodA/SpoVE family cell cycle protein [Staphylococcus saprophyticu